MESVVTLTVSEEEYIPPDSLIHYWHGFWRILWHWHPSSKGLVLPSLKLAWRHRKYCESRYRDKLGFGLTVWRISLGFSCEHIDDLRARYRLMFKDDIWPVVVLEDILDAEILESE